jgi:predicted transcriptional regulator
MSWPASSEWEEARVMEIIRDFGDNYATVSGITQMLWSRHGHAYLSAGSQARTVPQVRGVVTRLVNKGLVRREGDSRQRWYRLSSLGAGYMSDEVIKA